MAGSVGARHLDRRLGSVTGDKYVLEMRDLGGQEQWKGIILTGIWEVHVLSIHWSRVNGAVKSC